MSTPSEEWRARYKAIFEGAKENIRALKVAAPYMFHEYGELSDAKQNLESAKVRLALAQSRWDALGK